MTTLTKELAGYKNLDYEKVADNRFTLRDKELGKTVEFEMSDLSLTDMTRFHENIQEKNDFEYQHGYGFYLEGYTEFGVIGFMDKASRTSFEHGKRYPLGNLEFEVSKKSDLFHFLTWFEDKSQMESNTLKVYGVTKESYSSDIEKALFMMGVRFEDEFLEEYGEFFYPRILDIRESDIPCESFEFTEVSANLDWSCPVTGNLALFNQGESTSRYNFFAFYRFIETFIKTGRETEELTALLKSLQTEQLLGFAKETRLIDEDGDVEELAKLLVEMRNRYVYERPGDEPDGKIQVEEMAKWKVITKEIAIQLLNSTCRIQPDT